MDRLLESVNQQASSAALNTAVEEQFYEGLFQQFMVKNPVWDFHSLTKEQHLAKGRDKKIRVNEKSLLYNEEWWAFVIFVFFVWKMSQG